MTSRMSVICSGCQAGSAARTCNKPAVYAAHRNYLGVLKSAGGATLLSAALLVAQPAAAELNRLEAEARVEFGVGTAQQYGEADIKGRDFSNQVIAVFTALDTFLVVLGESGRP